MAGIYIHIPFCKQACFYCDFHFSTSFKSKSELVESICKEIELRELYFGKEELIETIYFGGGTPSVLEKTELEKILLKIHKTWKASTLTEICLEANPDDITIEKLKEWKDLGINRLSIGIQSFDDQVLKFMNRCHTASDALKSVAAAKEFGFENLNLDLIFGVPNSTYISFETDLSSLISLQPNHISTYCLTVEPQTVFGKRLKKGNLTLLADETANRQYAQICQSLENNNYEQYEISNFSKPQQYSKHNLAYWQNKKFLGLGPSAHSYDGEKRYFNPSSNIKYIKSLKQNKLCYETEHLSLENQMNEYILTKLRTKWGIDTIEFQNRFGKLNCLQLKTKIDFWIGTKDLKSEGNTIILNAEGKLIADSICENLFF